MEEDKEKWTILDSEYSYTMKYYKLFKITIIAVMLFYFTPWFINRYIMSNWYSFDIGNYEVTILYDECFICGRDWEVNHTIWVKDRDSGQSGKYEFFSEVPELEIGLNQAKNQMLINSPTVSGLLINLQNFRYEDFNFWGMIQEDPGPITIEWGINKNEVLEFYPEGRAFEEQ